MNCYPGVQCLDKPAPLSGHTCGDCPQGFIGDGVDCQPVCEFPDENSIFGAKFNLEKFRKIGQEFIKPGESFTLSCRDGFEVESASNGPIVCQEGGRFQDNYDSSISCADIDECDLAANELDQNNNFCSNNSNCVNTIGSYICICKNHFIGGGEPSEVVNKDKNEPTCNPLIELIEINCKTTSPNSIFISWELTDFWIQDKDIGISEIIEEILILYYPVILKSFEDSKFEVSKLFVDRNSKDKNAFLDLASEVEQKVPGFRYKIISGEDLKFYSNLEDKIDVTSMDHSALDLPPNGHDINQLKESTEYTITVLLRVKNGVTALNPIQNCQAITLSGQAGIANNLQVRNIKAFSVDLKFDVDDSDRNKIYAYFILTEAVSHEKCLEGCYQ